MSKDFSISSLYKLYLYDLKQSYQFRETTTLEFAKEVRKSGAEGLHIRFPFNLQAYVPGRIDEETLYKIASYLLSPDEEMVRLGETLAMAIVIPKKETNGIL